MIREAAKVVMIVLPETGLAGALALSENLRLRVESHAFVFQTERIPVAISVGCAELGKEDRTAAHLIQRADERLYEAKRGGRNRVCG